MNTNKTTTTLLLLFTGVLMGAIDISIVGPAIPSIEKSMLVGERDVSWIFSIYILFNLIGIPLLARLSDVFGRRLIYIFSVAVFAIGSVVVALAQDISLLLIGRAIQGFGSSGIFPVAVALVGDIVPPGKRGRALGLIGSVFGIAFMLGPFIAGFVLRYYDWNALFLINVPVAILIMVASMRAFPNLKPGRQLAIDWTGIVMLAIILSSFTLALNNLDVSNLSSSLGSWSVLPFLMLTILLTPLLLMIEEHHKDPVLNVRLFNSTQVRIVGFIAFGLGLFQSSIVFLPKLAVELFKVDASTASFMLLPVVAATALGSPLAGRLVDKAGSKVVIISGLVITAAALFMLFFLFPSTSLFYVAGGLLGLGLSMRASLNYIMLNEVPSKDRASTQGILLIFISVGQISGAALVGAIASVYPGTSTGFGIAFLVMTIISSILVMVSFFLKPYARERSDRFANAEQESVDPGHST